MPQEPARNNPGERTVTLLANQKKRSEEMRKPLFKDGGSYGELVDEIKRALEHEVIVASDEEAEQYFAECGVPGPVLHRRIVYALVECWDAEDERERAYEVTITEHYTDPGSTDYLYSYYIS